MNRKTFFLAVPLFIAIFLVACEEDDNNAEMTRERLLQSPPYKGITDSIKQSPSEPALYLQRAVRLAQNNLHEAATPDYRKAYELSDDAGVAMEYAANLFLANEVEEAVKVLEDGQKKFPEDTEFGRRLGELYAQNGDYSRAMQQYDAILAVDSTDFETWYNRGVMQAQIADTAGAIQSLENSFRNVPALFSGLSLANLYAMKRDPRALEIADFMIERDTTDQAAHAFYIKGVYYSTVGKPQLALKEFENAINRDWKFTDAYIDAGIIHFEGKQMDKAMETFVRAATVSNTDPDAYYWIARCHEVQGQKQDAIENYERALALDRTMVEARNRLRRLKSS